MDPTTLLLARLFTVTAAGLFSYSMISLVLQDRLQWYLADQKFEFLVLSTGLVLAGLVLLKMRTLQRAAHAHGHDHDHGHAHDHGHDHGHDHSHDQPVSLWRFVILAFPLMIIMTGLAPTGLSAQAIEKRMTKAQRLALEATAHIAAGEGRALSGEPVPADWNILHADAKLESARAHWEKLERPVKLSGQFVPDNRFQDRYRLMRLKIVCCAADATPTGITVIGPIGRTWRYGQWLEVTGSIAFVSVPDGTTGATQYFPIMRASSAKETVPLPYLQ